MESLFSNDRVHFNQRSHATAVVWQLDPTSPYRPANTPITDRVSVYKVVSGQLAWSFEGVVQGSLTATCPVTGSGTEALVDNSENQTSFLYINWTNQPVTYQFQGSVDNLPGTSCLDSSPMGMDTPWAQTDLITDPVIGGTEAAPVLTGTYKSGGTAFGTISETYSWSFTGP